MTERKAEYLTVGDIIQLGSSRQAITNISKRNNHVYVCTDYTDITGGASYDFDRCDMVDVISSDSVFLILPECHGNGGWLGFEVLETFESLEKGLQCDPVFEPVYSPYGHGIINCPRLCLEPDPNKAKYIYDPESLSWIKHGKNND